MLRGHDTARIDGKGRLKVPAEFLDRFLALCREDRRVFLTSLDGVTALLYPLPVWERHEAELAELPETHPAVRKYRETVNYWGKETSLDGQGRILIHPLLRDAAGLEGTASVFGDRDRLRIRRFEDVAKERLVVSDEDLGTIADLIEQRRNR